MLDWERLLEEDVFEIAGRRLKSRLIIGSGKFKSFQENKEVLEASGAEMITVAVRRVNITDPNKENLLDYIDPKKYLILPNTAGCYSAEEAIKTAMLAREATGINWIKLEVIGEELTEEDLEVPYEELERAYEEIEPEVRTALEVAHERIRRFHEKQLERSFLVEEDGILLGMRVFPLERVGIYVPGGQSVLPLHRPYERGAGGCSGCGRGDYGFPKTQQIHLGVCLHCGR